MSGLFPPGDRRGLFGLGLIPPNSTAKPRSRAEWRDRFSFWGLAESKTETAKIEAAKRRVSRALQTSHFLNGKRWVLVPQGSWHNRTNVRSDSDVDLCVCLQDTYFFECADVGYSSLDDVGLLPLSFSFKQFKDEIQRCLMSHYGAHALVRGNKALHLHKDLEERVSVDVVPTFIFRRYGPLSLLGRRVIAEGVALETDGGKLVTNYPEQHLLNGRSFHGRTGRRFKKVVRILKRMRNHIGGNDTLPKDGRERIRNFPSFFIECMVFNCPVECFGHPEIFDDVVAVLTHLHAALSRLGGLGILSFSAWVWSEVNREKSLFGNHQPVTPSQALEFVSSLKKYME